MSQHSDRPRAREAGVLLGDFDPGRKNAITDVTGILVGQVTLVEGDSVRTGVTAVIPRGDLLARPVRAAIHWTNAYGKLVGSTQVDELGEIETPILLTSTLNVPRVADALLDYVFGSPGSEKVESVNPIVAETNDHLLNDARARRVGAKEVFDALRNASDEVPQEGSVGAGTGTVAFGFKGGIGSSSRLLSRAQGSHTVGVMVQTNYGGTLSISGAPVGPELRKQGYPRSTTPPTGGSVIVVVGTDAPVDSRNLGRLATRAMFGIARTGSSGSNRSGDYAIAFSSSEETTVLSNAEMDPLFGAVIEATEEAVYNSLFRATTVTGRGRTIEELPMAPTLEILRRYHRLEGS